ncbi:hypothetical protein GV794_26500 [Nocardia cyriacigeorgica]|uniref:DUF2273 domain-containing protein n=1 Tax=Nocardia cyriacigeorgica TaxID=135487 RepID=A0A6P1D184_9NOCA|nr:hypothetical protein [Nocardia cyriacigeorgica]NEW40949.1 hypothetical protein [Nocardia cyriacigeorgica]NEW44256.1 hypothetical protein [Nocardia cyriacigeorgica]NEW51245.1 hypothetical protein [Nocardia cyriacigeorgica]NEW59158.1 hypothetical protein [Nocardia cyriacigeorgica]
MNATTICLAIGIAVGFAAAFGGFGAFLIVLVFAALGLVVGRWLDGELDLAGLVRSAQNKGRR